MPPTRAGELLTAIIIHNAPAQAAACADWLARCAAANADPATLMHPPAVALLQSLPGDRPHAPAADYGHRPAAPIGAMVVDVLSALEGIDPELVARALEHFLSNPTSYATDAVLLPAALRLHESEHTHGYPSVQALRKAVLSLLRRRIAEPLAPPPTGGGRARSPARAFIAVT